MIRCSNPDCSWRAIAPSEDAAWSQYVQHLVDAHSRVVDAAVPDGMVQVKFGRDGAWITTTVEEARKLHDVAYEE